MTKPTAAEDLLAQIGELIQQINSPAGPDEVNDDAAAGDEEHSTATGLTSPVDIPGPWADISGLEEINLLYKMPPEVVAKMNWVIDKVPRMSKQRIVREAVDNYLDMVWPSPTRTDTPARRILNFQTESG